uniref:Uncharacterized protein n=1 Tax=Megaviridae environmental sample TaxID=1737588 RepID=A0A5J6VK54_9VIRU|nr:MAG: hypothetical protein [Megaviridae environmental sample]
MGMYISQDELDSLSSSMTKEGVIVSIYVYIAMFMGGYLYYYFY